MKNRMIYVIYGLIILIIVTIIFFTKNVLKSVPKIEDKSAGVEPLEIKTFPNVNDECTFNVTYLEYGNLTQAGCTGGYTRYNINDIVLNGKKQSISIIYSDKSENKTGLYIGDKRIIIGLKDITNIKFGIFKEMLFIYNNEEINVLSINDKGKTVYDLSEQLKKQKIKDLSTGDIVIKPENLDPNSFIFSDGYFEFDAITGKCDNNENTKGSHYKVNYTNEKFEKPEFEQLIKC